MYALSDSLIVLFAWYFKKLAFTSFLSLSAFVGVWSISFNSFSASDVKFKASFFLFLARFIDATELFFISISNPFFSLIATMDFSTISLFDDALLNPASEKTDSIFPLPTCTVAGSVGSKFISNSALCFKIDCASAEISPSMGWSK